MHNQETPQRGAEEKKTGFGRLTPRMRQFRETLLDTPPSICAERARIATECCRLSMDAPPILRRSLIYKSVLEDMSIFIEPETLLAGNLASASRGAPIFPEYGMDWVIAELEDFEKRDGDRFFASGETKQALRDIAPFWEHNTVKGWGVPAVPGSAKAFFDAGLIQAPGNAAAQDAHIALDYRYILQNGLKDYQRRAAEKLSALNLSDYRDAAKAYFYRAVIIVIDATVTLARRYAVLAHRLAADEPALSRKAELEEMSRILNKVPFEPAETFYEAVQSIWFVHLCLHIESCSHSISYGRMDQYLYPFYRRDRNAGILSEELAGEVLANLWIKTFSLNRVRSAEAAQFASGSPLYQNVTIGGQILDAEQNPHDGVNPLSLLILKSIAQTRLPQPNLTVRYHRGIDRRFMEDCVAVLSRGLGLPAFTGDEAVIPALVGKGVSYEDAYGYASAGRTEAAIPGKQAYRCTAISFLNLPKALLIALNNGTDPHSGISICRGTGHFRDMRSFDAVMQAWDQVIRELTRQCAMLDSAGNTALESNTPDVLCSALCDDCIERGLNLKEGGGVYDFISDLGIGVRRLGDSLSAIKKCVFEDKSVSPADLWSALENRFAGPKPEQIQRLLLNAPKYGAESAYVEPLARQAYDRYLQELKGYHDIRYGRNAGGYAGAPPPLYPAIPQTPLATPDGRNDGAPPPAEPAPRWFRRAGTAQEPAPEKITPATLFSQTLAPRLLESPADRERLLSLMQDYFSGLQGVYLQFNVVSKETLLDAQARPEAYRDLMVREPGYSAFFTMLSRERQQDILKQVCGR